MLQKTKMNLFAIVATIALSFNFISCSKDSGSNSGGGTPPPPAPIVTSFTPTQGYTGTLITIKGSNFKKSNITAVKIGNANAASYTVVDDNTIKAYVGSGATGTVSATNAGGTGSSTATFTYKATTANSLLEKVNNETDLTSMEKLIGSVNLGDSLNVLTKGPYTIFAPIDALFSAIQYKPEDQDSSDNADILRYHIIKGKILYSTLPANAKNLKYETINSPADSVFVTKLTNVPAMSVNGSIIATSISPFLTVYDINTQNGVLHKFNGILLPASNKSLYETISSPGYDSIKKAIDRASIADPSIKTMLQSGTATLIAPNNAAFSVFLNAQTFKSIDAWDPTACANAIKKHVLSNREYILDFIDANLGSTGRPSLGGGLISYKRLTDNTIFTYGGPNDNEARIDGNKTDIRCKNGVIHSIQDILIDL